MPFVILPLAVELASCLSEATVVAMLISWTEILSYLQSLDTERETLASWASLPPLLGSIEGLLSAFAFEVITFVAEASLSSWFSFREVA